MANGTIAFDTLQTSGQISGTAKSVDTDFVVNGSARNWIKYNQSGTIAINDSFNVASITDETTGTTTVTFTSAMINASYSIKGQNSENALHTQVVSANQATSAYRQRTLDGGGSLTDDTAVYGDTHGDLA
tara:strand:- start:29 stop:418 length:390 start_codon:yes stop_codon:yes gene_type:complete